MFDDGIVDPKDIEELIGRLEKACKDAADNSDVFIVGSKEYTESHSYYADSSSFPSHAVVRPGSAKGISNILAVVEDLRVPFSIKGGGHAMAPFHPPPQIIQTAPVKLKPWFLIDMLRFDELIYNEGDQTVTVGAGYLWKDVNSALEKEYTRGVVGGSGSSAAGVAGFLMGGGYSFPKTNQFGLGIDNVEGYEVVLPSGKIKTVRPTDDDPADVDLFHALRGGGANFGIVTKFILKTHYQAVKSLKIQSVDFPGSRVELAKKVILHWIEHEHRPQAAMLAYFRYDLTAGKTVPKFTIACSFALNPNNASEAPHPPGQNLQDDEQDSQSHKFYKELSHTEADVLLSSAYTSKPADAVLAAIEQHRHLERVQGQTVDLQSHVFAALGRSTESKTRGRFGCIMVKKYTPKLLDEIHKQADEASRFLRDHSGLACFIKVWPFLSTIFDDSPEGAAWPHKKGEVYGPCWAYFQWTDEMEDRFWLEKMKNTLDALRKVAESEKVTSDDAPVYLNTTLEDTPVEKIYQKNLEHLKLMRERYDPKGIMSLTGGFKIPPPPTA